MLIQRATLLDGTVVDIRTDHYILEVAERLTPAKGERVFDAARNEIGKLAHVVIDLPTGKVAFAVLERGGVFGIGAQLLTIPWDALKRDAEHECFVVDDAFRSSYIA